MPTFTTIALENLLEPHVRKTFKSAEITKKRLAVADTTATADDNYDDERQRENAPVPKHIYISPALYVTPEPAPIPDVSSEYSPSPSPYVVNHKRRGGRTIGGFEIPPPPAPEQQQQEEKEEEIDLDLNLGEGEEEDDNLCGVEVENEESKGVENENENINEYEDENECFLDPIGSNRFESHSFVSAQADFFDAIEEFSSDGAISSASPHGASIESELRTMRLSLLDEIERRRTAEDALKVMQIQWHRIGNLLAQAGLSFPAPPNAGGRMHYDDVSLEQLAQEIIVARFVAEAVGKGEARAEAEVAAEAILESKEQEISRLRDRLQYYEAVNHEMSQRNQEIVDLARKQRQRKKRQRKWLWSCIGLSIAIGTSMIAYSHLSTSKHQPLPSSSSSADAASGSSSETA